MSSRWERIESYGQETGYGAQEFRTIDFGEVFKNLTRLCPSEQCLTGL